MHENLNRVDVVHWRADWHGNGHDQFGGRRREKGAAGFPQGPTNPGI